MTLTVQRAADRFLTDIDWLDSKHSFNFGGHYREGDGGHGLLLVNNDDTVAPGGGFGTHGHRDMEIVTWVLSGKLEHHDSEGNHGVLYPGLAQRMSAGSGIRHSEMNASDTEPVHFVQMWVLPDTSGVAARLRAARHQRCVGRWPAGADRVGQGSRRGRRHPSEGCGAVGRPAARRRGRRRTDRRACSRLRRLRRWRVERRHDVGHRRRGAHHRQAKPCSSRPDESGAELLVWATA